MTAAISSVTQLVAVIRRQLSAQAPVGAAARPGAAGRNKAAGGADQAERYADANLGALIALRVRQIGRDDPNRGRKAFRVFLEGVLASHFGPAMVNEPAFHQVVDDVQQALEAHPDCQPLLARAIKELLAEQ